MKLEFNFQNTFVPLRFKITRILFFTTFKKGEKEIFEKYSYTNLFSPILRAFARCVLRGDDGVTIRRELEKLRVAFRRAAA